MPFAGLLLSFLSPGKLLEFGGKLLDFLKSPLGIALMIGLAYFIGTRVGEHRAEEVCVAEKRESQAQAASMDAGVAQSTLQDLRERVTASDERVLAAQSQITEERFRASKLSAALQECRKVTDEEWLRVRPRGSGR